METGEVGLITIEAENDNDAGYHDCVEDKKETDFRVSLMIKRPKSSHNVFHDNDEGKKK